MKSGSLNGPSRIQRTIGVTLLAVKTKLALAYLEGIVAISCSAAELIYHVTSVLKLSRNAESSLQLKKCNFFSETVDYLGHASLPKVTETPSHTMDHIKVLNYPRIATDLNSFVGLCNVFRRIISRFSMIESQPNKIYESTSSSFMSSTRKS